MLAYTFVEKKNVMEGIWDPLGIRNNIFISGIWQQVLSTTNDWYLKFQGTHFLVYDLKNTTYF